MSKLCLDIEDRIYAKKNSKRIIRNRYSGKIIVLSSKAYERSKEDIIWNIKSQAKGMKFDTQVYISYTFYIKGNQKVDFDNLIGSINDILQDAGVLLDDTLIEKGDFTKIKNANRWGCRLKIEDMSSHKIDKMQDIV